MVYIKREIFLLAALVMFYTNSWSQVNSEGVTAYFELTDSLRAGKGISESKWAEFFKLKGNRYFLSKYRRDSATIKNKFKTNLLNVYGPSAVNLNQQHDLELLDILYMRDNERTIRKYIKDLDEAALINAMYANAYSYLPEKFRVRKPGLTLMLCAPLVTNAGVKNDSIFTNIAVEHRFSRIRPGLVASHELHHILFKYRKVSAVPEKNEQLLFLALGLMSREGLADLIDKKHLALLPDTSFVSKINLSLTRFDSMIPELNTAIERLATGVESKAGSTIQALIRNGTHSPGFTMAMIIERNGFLADWLSEADNPNQLIYSYNKAAKLDKAKPPLFSDTAIAFLKAIDERVYK